MKTRIALMLILPLVFLGCAKDGRKAGLFGQPIEPTVNGTWTGNMTINGVTSQMELNLHQNSVAVTGDYNTLSPCIGGANLCAQSIDPVLQTEGTVEGRTTGPTFSLNFTIDNPSCTPTLQGGGQNDGTTLSFNVTGTDCQGGTLRGQATLIKQQ